MTPIKTIFNALSGRTDKSMFKRYKAMFALAGGDKQSLADAALKDAFVWRDLAQWSQITGYDPHLQSMRQALEHGANPNATVYRENLSANRASQNAYDMGVGDYIYYNFSESYLSAAVLTGSVKATQMLLEHGAKPDSTGMYNGAGAEKPSKRSALHIAVMTGQKECAALLLVAGASIDGVDCRAPTASETLTKDFNRGCGGLGVYPLVAAVINRDRKMVSTLLTHCQQDLSKTQSAAIARVVACKLTDTDIVRAIDEAVMKSAGRQPAPRAAGPSPMLT